MKERLNVASGAPWEASVGYSRAVRAGDHVFVTGTTAVGPDGRVEGDAYEQATRALATIARALEAAGATMDDVVRTRIYVVDIAGDGEAVGRAHREALGHVRPATSMIEVRALIDPAMRVEIEADAVAGARGGRTVAVGLVAD